MYIFEKAITNIKNAIKNVLKDYDVKDFDVEIPSDEKHGDLSSNVALLSAKVLKMAPIKIAQMITSNIGEVEYVEKIEIAGPGFINFFLSKNYFADALKEIEKCGKTYGDNSSGKNKKIMIEFVSANPTGPMHMGNARLGALGDCLAEVLKSSGYDVFKEFYVNDAGNQIEKFGMSLDVRYRQIIKGENAVQMPENGYHGDDIKELAQEFFEINGDKYINADEAERTKALVDYALPKNIKRMQTDMEKYKIIYDNWFYESKLHSEGKVAQVIDIMKEKGITY